MSIFIKFGNIEGSVSESGHKNWSHAEAINFNCSRRISQKVGYNYNREASMPNLREVGILKDSDKSSPQSGKAGSPVSVGYDLTTGQST